MIHLGNDITDELLVLPVQWTFWHISTKPNYGPDDVALYGFVVVIDMLRRRSGRWGHLRLAVVSEIPSWIVQRFYGFSLGRNASSHSSSISFAVSLVSSVRLARLWMLSAIISSLGTEIAVADRLAVQRVANFGSIFTEMFPK
jgi:hypothetical protein